MLKKLFGFDPTKTTVRTEILIHPEVHLHLMNI